MCGIVAIVSPDGSALDEYIPGLEGKLDEALDRIQHRGPDGKGIWVDESRAVGMYPLRPSFH